VQILAVGIGMQDLVTNLGVAKAGLSRMAAVACLGSPLLNVQMGL
jgi:Ca2+/Na+ antiporter